MAINAPSDACSTPTLWASGRYTDSTLQNVRLSPDRGYSPNELNGDQCAIGRMFYSHTLGKRTLHGFNTPICIGGSLESGKVWQNTKNVAFDNTLITGNVYVVFDIFIGPVYLTYGAARVIDVQPIVHRPDILTVLVHGESHFTQAPGTNT